jgi:PII-like signaling protein
MKRDGEMTLLRVYLRNTDRYGWWSKMSDALLIAALQHNLAGATVLQGFYGLDCRGRLLQVRWWSLVEHRPLIVEFHDSPAVIGRFLGVVAAMIGDGMASLERSHTLLFRSSRQLAQLAGRPLAVPPKPAPLANLPPAEEFSIMQRSEDGQLLRIFIDLNDRWEGAPLYQTIVLEAQRQGLAGATVIRPPEGFGAHKQLHSVKFIDYASDLPILVEIVDTTEKISGFLPFLDQVVAEGLVTIEGVRILKFRRSATPG